MKCPNKYFEEIGGDAVKVDYSEITDTYKDFFEAQNNQIEIFQQMRTALLKCSTLESFSGDAADHVKAYLTDLHINLVNTFGLALMELEIRLLTLEQNFSACVDNSDTAILDNEYIAGVSQKITGYMSTFDELHSEDQAIISRILDLLPLGALSDSTYTSLQDTQSKTDICRINLENFDTSHASDLSSLNELFTNIDQAFLYMGQVCTPAGITYTAGACNTLPWSQNMSTYQIEAYFYAKKADPNFYDTIYIALAADTGLDVFDLLIDDADEANIDQILKVASGAGNLSTFTALLATTTGLTESAVEAFQLFRSGLVFTTTKNSAGIFISATTRAGTLLTMDEQISALKAAGIGQVKCKTIRALFESPEGLLVKSNLSGVKATEAFDNVNPDWEALSKLSNKIKSGDFSEAGTLSEFGKVMKGTSKVLTVVGGAITLGVDITDACYDERTKSLAVSNINGSDLAADVAVDAAAIAAPYAATAVATWGATVFAESTLVGTLAIPIPVVGTIVGVVVGVAIVVGSVWKYGEPPKTAIDNVKDWAEDTTKDIGQWFAKVFW
jgi:hypothetical protein